MEVDEKESVKGRDDNNHDNIQFWFRAPKMWDEFLEAKAVEEFCSKSDLLRHAFRQFFGQELKQYRAHLSTSPVCKSYTRDKEPDNCDSGTHGSVGVIPVNLQKDPWIESMAAFVANKRSCETRRIYRIILTQFFTFVAKHPGNVKQSDVIRYRCELEKRGKAPSSIRQHLAAISGYYSFCIYRDLTAHNPVKGVSRPSVEAYTESNWLSPVQAKRLIAQPDCAKLKGKRDFAILLTLLLTGLRRKELANVRRGDVREKDGKIYLTYNCKGGNRIARDIPGRCWDAIQSYLIASGRQITDDSPLFTALANNESSGRNGNGHRPITPETIRQLVIYYSRQAFGDEIKVRPHTLRHTAGTLLRKSGCSVEEVQSFLKHKRLDTTRRYLHVVEASDSAFGENIARMLDL